VRVDVVVFIGEVVDFRAAFSLVLGQQISFLLPRQIGVVRVVQLVVRVVQLFVLVVLLFRHDPRIRESPNGRLQCGRFVKERWARPDSNRRPPPCEDGGS